MVASIAVFAATALLFAPVLSAIRPRTRSLLPVIVLHLAVNTVAAQMFVRLT